MSKYIFSEQNAAPAQLSAGGCVRMGIRETAKQITTHLVASWPFALLFALSWALVFRISVHIVSGGGISVLLGVAAVFLSLLSVSCAWQVGATKVLCLQQMPPRRIVWRPICRRELLLTLFRALCIVAHRRARGQSSAFFGEECYTVECTFYSYIGDCVTHSPTLCPPLCHCHGLSS